MLFLVDSHFIIFISFIPFTQLSQSFSHVSSLVISSFQLGLPLVRLCCYLFSYEYSIFILTKGKQEVIIINITMRCDIQVFVTNLLLHVKRNAYVVPHFPNNHIISMNRLCFCSVCVSEHALKYTKAKKNKKKM